MKQEELLNLVDRTVVVALDNAFCDDQAMAIKKAVLGTIITLIDAGALAVPRYTPDEERQFRAVERRVAAQENMG